MLQSKKDLKKSLVTKYPKSEINGLWEEIGGFCYKGFFQVFFSL